MHSSETLPAPPTTGPGLLLQLGRLIIRSRSASPASRAPRDRLLHAKLLAAKPSTSQQVLVQPKESEEPKPGVEAQLSNHVQALWNDQIPLCIEVLLTPECPECYSLLSRVEHEGTFDKQHVQHVHHAQHVHHRALLLERWTMRAFNKSQESPAVISPQWLLNAVRSQLHFSQLSAWFARLKETNAEENTTERRRKLSRETCNYKKLEANCDETELIEDLRKLNIVYSIKIPGESYNMAEFMKPPTDHNFPVTDLGSDVYIKVVLQSLPRLDDIPIVKCSCAPKRRTSKEIPTITHEELVGKLNDLTIRPTYDGPGTVVDDRMLTPCSENGKHKCNCDDESDSQKSTNQTKTLDERRLKEIAKYKRRLRKESKMRKLCDSTSSEGDGLQKRETRTSIPILQAARFDRFRAIGCYRNQTYLTLPTSRIETKSPFIIDTYTVPDTEFKRTNTVGTQTDDLICGCGNTLEILDDTERKMIRSEATYNLASLDQSEVLLHAIKKCQENGARRKFDEIDDDKSLKKHKCDNSLVCDNDNDNTSIPIVSDIIKRPKLRRVYPIVDRIKEIVSDRYNAERDIKDLHLKSDDTVFSGPKDTKRQKTYSVGDDNYVCYEKCDYGSFDSCEFESPKDEKDFVFSDSKKGADNQIPSPSEMDRFRWRFDSAASMVFHSKTGLPLTSSPAPLRRGNNCFDFDDSINGISGIKSALFHPISTPPSPPSPTPAPPPACPAPPPPLTEQPTPKLRIGPSAGLLGSFEESALKGRLEPVATVHGFTAELGASGAFCPPHKRLPVTVFFYAPGGTNAPYMGHINLGTSGYRVARSGTVQVSLFNPHGTLVKMFVVLYDLTSMPAAARTFLRQRTLYMPAAAPSAAPDHSCNKWLRYLIHLRFMTSKSGKLYLHTDIRIIVSRKADLDTATAHSALFQPIPTRVTNGNEDEGSTKQKTAERTPNRVFGGCGDYSGEKSPEICYGNQNGVSYELRSFTYAPENPKYSPR